MARLLTTAGHFLGSSMPAVELTHATPIVPMVAAKHWFAAHVRQKQSSGTASAYNTGIDYNCGNDFVSGLHI